MQRKLTSQVVNCINMYILCKSYSHKLIYKAIKRINNMVTFQKKSPACNCKCRLNCNTVQYNLKEINACNNQTNCFFVFVFYKARIIIYRIPYLLLKELLTDFVIYMFVFY